MDKTVIILISLGVTCFFIGIGLYFKLSLQSSKPKEEESNLLDEEYIENFKECFKNTNDIEETLEQLLNIYMGNQYMYSLINDALDFIRDEQGDYETALERINVEDDITVLKMHTAAIKRALNIASENHHEDVYDEPKKQKSNPHNHHKESSKSVKVQNDIVDIIDNDIEDDFDEDIEEDIEDADYKDITNDYKSDSSQKAEKPLIRRNYNNVKNKNPETKTRNTQKSVSEDDFYNFENYIDD